MNFVALHPLRLTKIVCTIGPACWTRQEMQGLASSGMNVARINVSHGTRQEHHRLIEDLTTVTTPQGAKVAILLDTRGCEIRTGDVQDPIEISKGEEVLFVSTSIKAKHNGSKIIEVGYDRFGMDVKETDRILIDNGAMSFDIVSIREDGAVLARAREAGSVGSRRHINLPGADIDLPSITDADWDDIAFAVDTPVDFIALSFIRDAEEVTEVKKFLIERGSDIQLVTKIETQQSLERLSEIIDVSDAVMVARGDLGSEVPIEHLPVVQDDIVHRCRDAGKPVIIATHMLESMRSHPIPTRAEVTDVAHAATQRSDATMLSGETAGGKHPNLAVETMDKILRATETHMARFADRGTFALRDKEDTHAQRVVQRSRTADVRALVAEDEEVALRLSKFRPGVPIVAPVTSDRSARRLQLPYGIYPFIVEDGSALEALTRAKAVGIVGSGGMVLSVSQKSEETITV